MENVREGKMGGGMRKMFYFSFDNKEEMFIRSRQGREKESNLESIQFTINIY